MGLPQPDIAAVAAACATVRDAVRAGKLASAHDISDGGLACALAESAIGAGLGCRVDVQPLRERGCSPEEALFGEGSGGFLLSGERAALEALGAICHRRGRRHHDRDRRRRPQPHRRPRRPPRAPGARCRRRPSATAPESQRGEDREEVGAVGGAERLRQRGRVADDRDQDRGAEDGADLAEGGVDGAGGGEAVVGDVADGGGAEGREGEADADPGQAGAGQPEAEPVGLGAGRAQDHDAGGEEERAGDDHGAVAEAVGEAAGGAGDDGRERRARAASRRRPGARCSPRSR